MSRPYFIFRFLWQKNLIGAAGGLCTNNTKLCSIHPIAVGILWSMYSDKYWEYIWSTEYFGLCTLISIENTYDQQSYRNSTGICTGNVVQEVYMKCTGSSALVTRRRFFFFFFLLQHFKKKIIKQPFFAQKIKNRTASIRTASGSKSHHLIIKT